SVFRMIGYPRAAMRGVFGCLLVVISAASHTQPPEPATGPGTLADASARVRWKKRPLFEGTIPDPVDQGSCPSAMANIGDRFCIDRWEATIGEDGHASSAPGVVPHGYVSGMRATDACRAAGKRLCSAAEWRFACGGTKQTVHPYGAEY